MSLNVGDLIDVSLGDGLIQRLEIHKKDEHRGWFILRTIAVRRDPLKGAALGHPHEETQT